MMVYAVELYVNVVISWPAGFVIASSSKYCCSSSETNSTHRPSWSSKMIGLPPGVGWGMCLGAELLAIRETSLGGVLNVLAPLRAACGPAGFWPWLSALLF